MSITFHVQIVDCVIIASVVCHAFHIIFSISLLVYYFYIIDVAWGVTSFVSSMQLACMTLCSFEAEE